MSTWIRIVLIGWLCVACAAPAVNTPTATTVPAATETPISATAVVVQEAPLEPIALLQAQSRQPLTMSFIRQMPATIHLAVPASGETPQQRGEAFLRTYADLFPMHADSRLQYVRSRAVDVGTMVTFQQYLADIPILGAELHVTITDDTITSIIANLKPTVHRTMSSAIPNIGESDAQRIARPDTDARALRLPATLVWRDDTEFAGQDALRLSWYVRSANPPMEQLIDAHDGSVAAKWDAVHGDQSWFTDYDLDLEDGNGESGYDTGCWWWTTANDNVANEDGYEIFVMNPSDATIAFEAIGDVYQWYHDRYGQHSWDNDDAAVEVFINTAVKNRPSRWIGNCSIIEFEPNAVTDGAMAHEFTHGVLQSVGKIGSGYAASALMEALADLMAVSFMAHQGDPMPYQRKTQQNQVFRDLWNPINDDFANMNAYAPNAGAYKNMTIFTRGALIFVEGGKYFCTDSTSCIPKAGESTQNTIVEIPPLADGYARLGAMVYHSIYATPAQPTFEQTRNVMVNYALNKSVQAGSGWTKQDVCRLRNAFWIVGIGLPDLDCNGIEDGDADQDGVNDGLDNCPKMINNQEDKDGDGVGDSCDADMDGDGYTWPNGSNSNLPDNCPTDANPDQTDANFNGKGSMCDPSEDGDVDDDTVPDAKDNCLLEANTNQKDTDKDGAGDACDPDDDGDGVSNDNDNCPFTPNKNQKDSDNDGTGDVCDPCPKADEGIYAWTPGVPELGIDPKPVFHDVDNDGTPDACDDTLDFKVVGGPLDIKKAPLTMKWMSMSPIEANSLVEITIQALTQPALLRMPVCADGSLSRIRMLSTAPVRLLNERGNVRRYAPDAQAAYVILGAQTDTQVTVVTYCGDVPWPGLAEEWQQRADAQPVPTQTRPAQTVQAATSTPRGATATPRTVAQASATSTTEATAVASPTWTMSPTAAPTETITASTSPTVTCARTQQCGTATTTMTVTATPTPEVPVRASTVTPTCPPRSRCP